MDSITKISPAKLNFGLYITEKRSDGFHNIETVFYPLELSDTLLFEKSDEFSLQTTSEELNSDITSNLIYKAVRYLEEATEKKLPVNIVLEKNIPMGAGLGGGSSNAATTLLAITDMFELQISPKTLESIALTLGSDVPFFLQNRPAFATGRGEKLIPIDFTINKPILLVNPGIHVHTGWAYSQCKPEKAKYNLRSLDKNIPESFQYFRNRIHNDFEKIVFTKHPEIFALKEVMYNANAEFVLMSGSGSTLFAIFETLRDTQKAQKKLPPQYFSYVEHTDNNKSRTI